MTIGIVVGGENAGLAAIRALAAVEAVGRGAIGGFVSLAVFDRTGRLHRAETQRGGSRTLFTVAGRMSLEPPAIFAEAPVAALMSSGPDRPVPLSQFVAAKEGVGMVSGHRFANMAGDGGVAFNAMVLSLLEGGCDATEAVDRVLAASPQADAGLIAIDISGAIGLGNTEVVARRPDLGSALLRDGATGTVVGVLHNSIEPSAALAELAASVALDVVVPRDRADFTVLLAAGTRLERGTGNVIHIDADGRVTHVVVTSDEWFAKQFNGAAALYGAPVVRAGQVLGHVSFEPYCIGERGILVSMSGQTSVALPVRSA